MAPVDSPWRLVDVVTGHKAKHGPAIEDYTAALISIGFTLLYVLPFYLSPRTRPSPGLNRDAPSVIQARIRAVTFTVIVSTVTTFVLLQSKGQLSVVSALHYLGIWPISLSAIGQSLLLTFVLYLGPLYHDIFLQGSLSPLSETRNQIMTSLSSSIGYRNYIAGPATEELLFRSTILPIHLLSPLADSPKKLVFFTPLHFGIAHVHHFYEFRLTHPDTPILTAVTRTVFQFGYTTVFGWYAAFIYLRTGNLYAVFLIHAFCNYMGLPKLWGRIRLRSKGFNGPRAALTHAAVRSKDDTEVSDRSVNGLPGFLKRLDRETFHTIIYYLLLLSGVYGFAKSLFPLSDTGDLALVGFGS